ncbi:MAG: hypothetical protein AAF211_23305, partial [Myxococcota bacterium]
LYAFDTFGSDYDTVLHAHIGCTGYELACDDDSQPDFTSRIEVFLFAGESVILVVDGYDGDSGSFVLNGEAL